MNKPIQKNNTNATIQNRERQWIQTYPFTEENKREKVDGSDLHRAGFYTASQVSEDLRCTLCTKPLTSQLLKMSCMQTIPS